MDNRGFNDIDYNMLVDQQGAVYTGRGLSVVGAHAIGHNTIGYGVCVIGTNQLSGPARTAVRYLYSMCRDRSGHDLIVMGHSAVDQTQCPGDVIRTWMAHGWCNPRALLYDKRRQHMIGQDVRDVQRIVHAEPDGEFGPRTHARVRDWQAAHDLVADGIVGPLTRAGMGL